MTICNAVVIGSNGALGRALTSALARSQPQCTVHALSRTKVDFAMPNVRTVLVDYYCEASIETAASNTAAKAPLDLVLVATGILHAEGLLPEKSLRDLNHQSLMRVLTVNTIVPTLCAKHFLPRLNTHGRSVFAALSARVGSIGDNRLGGWYAYRASKAALNMVLKNAAIEIGRRNKNAIVVGLHPGTVESPLSKPFLNNVAQERLFTPQFAAERLLKVLAQRTPRDSGHCFAWDGERIDP